MQIYLLVACAIVATKHYSACWYLKSSFKRPFTDAAQLLSFSRCSLLCQEINQDDSFHLEYRGPVIMKGKPTPMDCWFLTRATSVANASGNGSLDSPLLQPTTPTAPQRMGMGLGMGMAGHASVSRTSSASGSGTGSATPAAPSDK